MTTFRREKHGPSNTFTVTRFCNSLCISCFTSSTIHPFGLFIILLEVSAHGWAHWWCNMFAPPCLPPSPLSVLLPPLRWNLKAKSGGCWEMNFRKRFQSFHNTVSLSPFTVSLCSSEKTNLTSDSWFQLINPRLSVDSSVVVSGLMNFLLLVQALSRMISKIKDNIHYVHLLWNDIVLKAKIILYCIFYFTCWYTGLSCVFIVKCICTHVFTFICYVLASFNFWLHDTCEENSSVKTILLLKSLCHFTCYVFFL